MIMSYLAAIAEFDALVIFIAAVSATATGMPYAVLCPARKGARS